MKRTAVAEKVAPSGASKVLSSNGDGFTFSSELLTLSSPLSNGAEAIRALRTHVVAQHLQLGRRALAICAPSEGVGCTFVAVNLAVALAQVGIKTLLVDGNLYGPEVQRFIHPKARLAGLSEYLAGVAGIDDVTEKGVLPNLSVIFAGWHAAAPQELLSRGAFETAMHQCLRQFDMTIIDTPPANTSADARRIANVVGYSLVVARRNRSLVSDVKTLTEQLADDHAKVIGTVMNAD